MATKSRSSGSRASSSARTARSAARSTAAPRPVDLVAAVDAADPNELRAAQAQVDAQNRAKAYDSDFKSGHVHGHAVMDHDARQIAQFFPSGNDKQQKEDATGYMGRLLGKTGDAPERNLSVVKVVEV